MTYYFKTGNTIGLKPSDALEVLQTLPVDTYIVKQNPMTGEMYLQTTDHMELPSKVYGEVWPRADRIINTFEHREKSTGVLLTGEKGSGKTLLSKALSVGLRQRGVSTIIINSPYCGPAFNELIGSIKQPALLLFDEFEKVYDEEDQQSLLTLFDGTVMTKKMFVLTTNTNDLNDYFHNRPGRIFYQFTYEGLEEAFIREYAEDNLLNKANIDGLVTLANTFSVFTFDMLSALIEEMNRYNETASTSVEYLNIDIHRQNVEYRITVLMDGKVLGNSMYPTTTHENPLLATDDTVEISVYNRREDDEKFSARREGFEYLTKGGIDLEFGVEHFKHVSTGGTTHFERTMTYEKKPHVFTMILKKVKPSKFNFMAF